MFIRNCIRNHTISYTRCEGFKFRLTFSELQALELEIRWTIFIYSSVANWECFYPRLVKRRSIFDFHLTLHLKRVKKWANISIVWPFSLNANFGCDGVSFSVDSGFVRYCLKTPTYVFVDDVMNDPFFPCPPNVFHQTTWLQLTFFLRTHVQHVVQFRHLIIRRQNIALEVVHSEVFFSWKVIGTSRVDNSTVLLAHNRYCQHFMRPYFILQGDCGSAP